MYSYTYKGLQLSFKILTVVDDINIRSSITSEDKLGSYKYLLEVLKTCYIPSENTIADPGIFDIEELPMKAVEIIGMSFLDYCKTKSEINEIKFENIPKINLGARKKQIEMVSIKENNADIDPLENNNYKISDDVFGGQKLDSV